MKLFVNLRFIHQVYLIVNIEFSDMGKSIYCLWVSATTIFFVVNLTKGDNTSSNHCVSSCSCDGPKIDCSNKYLYQIPDLTIIQTYVHSINFSDNEIETLSKSNFIYPRLRKMQELLLDRNTIYDIEETAFDSLLNLKYLDISNNRLESVSDHMIVNNTNLLQLNLAQNVFNPKTPKLRSKSLEILDLSDCKILHFGPSHVEHLPRLKVLHLNANQLIHIPHHSFDIIPLTFISLSYNYWKCNCDSLRLFHHLIHHNITIENSIQCLHDDEIFEDLTNLGEPIFNKTFCVNESKNEMKKNITHKVHHQLHHNMAQTHNGVEKQEDGGFFQNYGFFVGAMVGIIIVSLIASIMAWKVTNNKRIQPIGHSNQKLSHTLLIQ